LYHETFSFSLLEGFRITAPLALYIFLPSKEDQICYCIVHVGFSKEMDIIESTRDLFLADLFMITGDSGGIENCEGCDYAKSNKVINLDRVDCR